MLKMAPSSWYAPDRHAGCHLQGSFSCAFAGTHPCTGGNKDDVVWLEWQIRSLCCQNLLQQEWDLLRPRRGFADQLGRIQSRVGAGALSQGKGLQHTNSSVIFHDKTAGLADVADDVNESCLAYNDGVPGLDADVIFHRLRRTKRYPNRLLRIIAVRDQHVLARFRRRASGGGDGVVKSFGTQQRINAGLLYLAQH